MEKYGEFSHIPWEDIDPSIREVIYLMNRLGCVTGHSCSSDPEEHDSDLDLRVTTRPEISFIANPQDFRNFLIVLEVANAILGRYEIPVRLRVDARPTPPITPRPNLPILPSGIPVGILYDLHMLLDDESLSYIAYCWRILTRVLQYCTEHWSEFASFVNEFNSDPNAVTMSDFPDRIRKSMEELKPLGRSGVT